MGQADRQSGRTEGAGLRDGVLGRLLGRAASVARSAPAAPGAAERRSLALLALLVGVVALASLAQEPAEHVENTTLYAPVLNPAADSVAYLKRTTRYAETTTLTRFAPGFTFEKDDVQLCHRVLEVRRQGDGQGDERCTPPWRLPLGKVGAGSGRLAATLNWEGRHVRFDVLLEGFLWKSGACPGAAGRRAEQRATRMAERGATTCRLQGRVVGGRVVGSRIAPAEGAVELEHGPEVSGGLVARARPQARPGGRLFDNAVTVEPHREDTSGADATGAAEKVDPFVHQVLAERARAGGGEQAVGFDRESAPTDSAARTAAEEIRRLLRQRP